MLEAKDDRYNSLELVNSFINGNNQFFIKDYNFSFNYVFSFKSTNLKKVHDKGIDVFKDDKETIDLKKLAKFIKMVTKANFKIKGKGKYYKSSFKDCQD